jgi:MFS family permease
MPRLLARATGRLRAPGPPAGVPAATRAAVRRLSVARLLSMAGTDATAIALGFTLYAQTGSAAWLSLSLLVTVGAGSLLAPLGGWAGDRFDRRRLMVGSELAAALVLLALARFHSPALLVGLSLVATGLGALFGPASAAAIAHVAGDRHLTWATAVVTTGANVGKFAGRLGAGALIAVFGPGTVFALDAVTFLASAALIASVGLPFGAGAARAGARGRRLGLPDLGIAETLRHPIARPILASACISTFATSFSMTAEVPLVFALGGGAVALSALTAAWGLGMIAGSWHARRALHAGNEATGVLAGRLVMAAGIGAVALMPAFEPVIMCYLLGGLGGGFMGVAASSMVVRSAPPELRARTLATVDAARNLAFGAGVVLAGLLVGVLGPQPVYGAVGVTLLFGTLPLAGLVRRLGGLRPLRAPAPTGAPVTA